MVFKLFTKIFGSNNDRILKKIQPYVDKINDLEPEFKALTDEQMPQKTDEYKQRLKDGESLDDLLPEAFALEQVTKELQESHFGDRA